MKDQFVPYELALKLKELGFSISCLGYYTKGWEHHISIGDPTMADIFTNRRIMAAPLWQQAFDFFRKEYGLESLVYKFIGGGSGFAEVYSYKVYTCTGSSGDFEKGSNFVYDTYEEARQACLEQLIKIVQLNK